MPNPIRNRRTLYGSSVVYDADAVTLFAAMTVQPDSSRKAAINTFIKGVKADEGITSLSERFDCLYFTAAHDQQAARLNWAKRAHDLTEVNSPTWTLDRGYGFNGTTQYLNTNYNPSTQGVRFLQNTASFGLYFRTNVQGTGNSGQVDATTTTGTLLNARNGSDLFVAGINRAAAVSASSANTDSRGLFVVKRAVSTTISTLKNGSQTDTEPSTSAAPLSLNIYLGALNRNGTAALFDTRQIAVSFIDGGSINSALFYTRVQTYLTALGAQV